jgi:hypothetical protein
VNTEQERDEVESADEHTTREQPEEESGSTEVKFKLTVRKLEMKPTAPPLSVPEDAPESSLQSEIARACETAHDERITIPAPPTAEALKAATPCPPADEESRQSDEESEHEDGRRDTTPAPPPRASAICKRDDDEEEPTPEAIPVAPRVPKIHSM